MVAEEKVPVIPSIYELGNGHRLVPDPRSPDWHILICPRWGKVGFVQKGAEGSSRVCICGYHSHGPVLTPEKVNGSQ